MRVSNTEAISLLQKWSEESTRVFATLQLEGIDFFCKGCISSVTPEGVKICELREAGQRTFHIHLSWERVREYEYQELRETPEEARQQFGETIAGGLQMELSGGLFAILETV